MKTIIAIASLTVSESVRKKVFLVLALFSVILVCSTFFFPALSAQDKAVLAQTWSQRAILFFGMLTAIFLSSMSIPDDIEDRKLFLVFSKSVPRAYLVLGKMAGFMAVMAIFLLAMGVIGTVFIRIVSVTSGADISPRDKIMPFEYRVVSPAGSTCDAVGTYSEKEGFTGSISSGAVQDDGAYLEWEFEGLNPAGLDDSIKAVFTIEVLRGGAPGNVPAKVVFYSDSLKLMSKQNVVDFYYGKPMSVEFKKTLIGADGKIRARLTKINYKMSADAGRGSAYLVSSAGIFELNYFKGLLLTFFGIVLMIAVTVAASTVLSGPVALLAGVFLYLSGSLVGFITRSLVDMRLAIKYASVPDAGHGSGDFMPVWLMRVSDQVASSALAVIPDIGRFDATGYMLNNFVIPTDFVYSAAGYLVAFVAVSAIVGVAAMSHREFK